MTSVQELEQRLKQRTAPLFAQTGPSTSSERPDEKIPAGLVGHRETADCREKLQELLDVEGAIVTELDRRAAERLFKTERRFTKAEADFVGLLFGSYQTAMKR